MTNAAGSESAWAKPSRRAACELASLPRVRSLTLITVSAKSTLRMRSTISAQGSQEKTSSTSSTPRTFRHESRVRVAYSRRVLVVKVTTGLMCTLPPPG